MILMEEAKRLIDPWCTNGVVSDSAGDALEGLQVARGKENHACSGDHYETADPGTPDG